MRKVTVALLHILFRSFLCNSFSFHFFFYRRRFIIVLLFAGYSIRFCSLCHATGKMLKKMKRTKSVEVINFEVFSSFYELATGSKGRGGDQAGEEMKGKTHPCMHTMTIQMNSNNPFYRFLLAFAYIFVFVCHQIVSYFGIDAETHTIPYIHCIQVNAFDAIAWFNGWQTLYKHIKKHNRLVWPLSYRY